MPKYPPSRPTRTRYVTANDLRTGEAVFLGKDGIWASELAQAVLVTDPDVGSRLLARAQADGSRVVGPYLADAEQAAPPVAAHFRERLRATGPSNLFHGKQERERHV